MIPRVRSVLTQFLTPISTSTEDDVLFVSKDKKNQPFQRHQPQDFEEQPQTHLSLVDSNPPPSGLSHSLLQLAHFIQNKKKTIQTSLGINMYRNAIKIQKNKMKSLLGIMLDQKDK